LDLQEEETAGIFALFDLYNAVCIIQEVSRSGEVTMTHIQWLVGILRSALHRFEQFVGEEFHNDSAESIALFLDSVRQTPDVDWAALRAANYDKMKIVVQLVEQSGTSKLCSYMKKLVLLDLLSLCNEDCFANIEYWSMYYVGELILGGLGPNEIAFL
jgi:hypothetical protein